MSDVGSLPIDFLIYVVPGYVVLLAAAYAWTPELLVMAKDKLGVGQLVATVVAALLVGIVIHQLATVAINALNWPSFTSIVKDFEHSAAAQARVQRLVGFPIADPADAYFYGRVYIAEKAPDAADSARRLLQLANVCQNMIFAVLFAAWAVAHGARRRGFSWWRRFGWAVVLGLAVDAVFFYGLRLYWTAAIWRVLRAVLLFS